MIGYIKGILAEISDDMVVLECGCIGYNIRTTRLVLERLPSVGTEVKLYTYMHVREDAVSLFGFLSRDELEIFKMLLTVSSVGPKGALGILSVLSCSDLRIAVHSQDSKAIAKAPGIGSKTAQRIILDLKDKLKLEDAWDLEDSSGGQIITESGGNVVQKDATEALTALGYGASEAAAAVRKVEITPDMTVEDVLRASLKYML